VNAETLLIRFCGYQERLHASVHRYRLSAPDTALSGRRSKNNWLIDKLVLLFHEQIDMGVGSWSKSRRAGRNNMKSTRCSDKLGTLFLSSLSQANVDRFSNFFHQVIRKKILYVHIIKISTSHVICCYTTLWKSKNQKCYWLSQHLNKLFLQVPVNILRTWFNI